MDKKRKLCIWDFDGTLVDTPIASPENKEKWEKFYNKPWPSNGWWGRNESLDTKVFRMDPIIEVFNDYLRESLDGSNVMVLLTGRLEKQKDLVKSITDSIGYEFDHYLLNTGGKTIYNKIFHLNNLLELYPTVTKVEMWDDRVSHFQIFKDWGKLQIENGRIKSFHLNEIRSGQWDSFVE